MILNKSFVGARFGNLTPSHGSKTIKFQGQIVVPAAAYCIMTFDAASAFAMDQPVAMVELQELNISIAITLLEDGPGV